MSTPGLPETVVVCLRIPTCHIELILRACLKICIHEITHLLALRKAEDKGV